LSVLLDSVILIDHLNGVGAATRYLQSLKEVSISVITRAEVLAGLAPRDVTAVKALLDRYPTIGCRSSAATQMEIAGRASGGCR
jgi:predicted nucleic acid-binding protein